MDIEEDKDNQSFKREGNMNEIKNESISDNKEREKKIIK